MMVTLDGYFEGKDHDISWHNVDEEFDTFANKQLDEADTLVFGHRTYELMADFWPTQEAKEVAPGTARRMNSFKKVVFSGQVFTPTWEPTTALSDVQALKDLKQQPGKSIAVLGSSNLAVSLLAAGLIDEVRIMINPVIIGAGTPLFEGINQRTPFTLTSTRTFKNGNVLLCYDTQAASKASQP